MAATPGRPIVAGVDGSKVARAAARWAAGDAMLRGATLRLVHALDHPQPVSYPAPSLMAPPVTDHMREWARHLLQMTATELTGEHPELVVETVSADGTPWAVLVEQSTEALLTVVGSHGGGQLEDAVFGSVASRLAAHAEGSVVIVRAQQPVRPPDSPPGAVVVGVDGSAEADGAITFAFDEAALRGSALIALHAWNHKPLEHSLGHYRLHIDADAVHEGERRQLTAHLAPWVERYPSVPVQPVVLRGRAAAALLTYLKHAPDGPPQLVVVGRRGRGGFARLLLGSTSTALVAHADSPVVVVRGWGATADR